jgi:ribosomal protein L5
VAILTKNKIYNFLFKLILEILPALKNFKGISYKFNKLKCNSFSFYIKDLIVLKEFNPHFHLFNNLPALNITIITNTKNKNELIYLLQSFKLPLLSKS